MRGHFRYWVTSCNKAAKKCLPIPKKPNKSKLNRVTTEVLARLPHLRVIDKLTVVRKCQHLALIVDAGDPTYLEKFG